MLVYRFVYDDTNQQPHNGQSIYINKFWRLFCHGAHQITTWNFSLSGQKKRRNITDGIFIFLHFLDRAGAWCVRVPSMPGIARWHDLVWPRPRLVVYGCPPNRFRRIGFITNYNYFVWKFNSDTPWSRGGSGLGGIDSDQLIRKMRWDFQFATFAHSSTIILLCE